MKNAGLLTRPLFLLFPVYADELSLAGLQRLPQFCGDIFGPQLLLLIRPHQVEISRTPHLRSCEDAVQDWGQDLERQRPSIPCPTPEV